jgi:hypothetical protein
MTSTPAMVFTRVKSGKSWTDFASGLVLEGMSRNPPTQLCLFFKTTPMTEAVLNLRPSTSDAYLTEAGVMLEFEDGTCAARFMLRDKESITPFVNAILDAKYGAEKPLLLGGVVAGLPKEEKSSFLGLIGVPQGMAMGNVVMW